MAARKNAKKMTPAEEKELWVNNFAKRGIERSEVSDELVESMRSYISYTLTERALPYVDGLKPVHKRILWCMQDRGYRASGGYTKSGTVSGDIMGHYHAHADPYPVMAKLTRQKADDTKTGLCELNLCLVDGHGNFGNGFKDAPGASRYTEVRLSQTGEACTRDVKDNAVYMIPTYTAVDAEPEILPVRIPLLLINGSDGLAYGYNTDWMPHNPSEALNACIYRIDNPRCSDEEIAEILPGPDFPSGGIIVDTEGAENGLEAAIRTGFGRFSISSRYNIEPLTRGRYAIEFYQTPFGIPQQEGKSVTDSILVFADKHPEYRIADVKCLTGNENNGLIEVTLKNGADPQVVAAALLKPGATLLTTKLGYRQSMVTCGFETCGTPDFYGIENKLRPVSPMPKDVSVLDYIDEFIKFRRACVINSCTFRREKALSQKHLIDGLLVALLDIDEVIKVVRLSEDKNVAKSKLMKKFKLDCEQADYVLSLTLSRLTKSDKIDLQGRSKELAALAKELGKILSSEKNIRAEIRRQLEEELEKQTLPRRTTIVSSSGKLVASGTGRKTDPEGVAIANIVLGKAEACVAKAVSSEEHAVVSGAVTLAVSQDGLVSRPTGDISDYPAQTLELDRADGEVVFFGENGGSMRLHGYDLNDNGELLPIGACVGVAPYSADGKAFLATAAGKVKVLDMSTLTKARECPAISLSDGDRVVFASPVAEGDVVALVTRQANLLTFGADKVPSQGRTSGGVNGISLKADDEVLAAWCGSSDAKVLTGTDGGNAKCSLLSDFPPKGRATGGVRCHTMKKGDSALASAAVGEKVGFAKGSKVTEPADIVKRDASGVPFEGDIISFR